jgi:hypothetical protein
MSNTRSIRMWMTGILAVVTVWTALAGSNAHGGAAHSWNRSCQHENLAQSTTTPLDTFGAIVL